MKWLPFLSKCKNSKDAQWDANEHNQKPSNKWQRNDCKRNVNHCSRGSTFAFYFCSDTTCGTMYRMQTKIKQRRNFVLSLLVFDVMSSCNNFILLCLSRAWQETLEIWLQNFVVPLCSNLLVYPKIIPNDIQSSLTHKVTQKMLATTDRTDYFIGECQFNFKF